MDLKKGSTYYSFFKDYTGTNKVLKCIYRNDYIDNKRLKQRRVFEHEHEAAAASKSRVL